MSYIDASQEMRREETREKMESAFFDYIKPFWKQTERIQHYNEWYQFLNAIYTAADLADEQFKDVKKQKSKKTIFQQISDSPIQRIPLNLNTLMMCFDRLMMAYIGMKSQKMIEGPVINDENDILDPGSVYGLAMGGTYKMSIKNKEQHLKVILNKAKRFGVDDLADGYFGIAFKRLLDGLDLCKNLEDVFLLRWVKGENDDWFKLSYGEGGRNWDEGYFVIDKDFKIENDSWAFIRVRKGSTYKETWEKHIEKLKKKGILKEKVLKNDDSPRVGNKAKVEISDNEDLKPEKIITSPKMEKITPEPKVENEILKTHKMTAKQTIESLTKEFMTGLKDDLSNFKTSVMRLISKLKDDPNIDMSRKSSTYKQFKETLKELLNASKQQNKISEETYNNYYEYVKKNLRKKRLAEMTPEERKAYRQKQNEERQKRKEEREREENKDWTQDDDFISHFKDFLTSHSIHEYIANYPGVGMFLGPMSRDVRNDQQKLTKDIAEQVFAKQYGYDFLNKNQQKAFYELLEEYPNNFFDTEEEFQDYVKSWGEEIMSRERKKEFKILYGLFKRDLLKSVNRGLTYEPIDENELKTYDVEGVMIENAPIKAIVKEAVKEVIKKTKPKLSNLKRINEKRVEQNEKPSINAMNEVDKAKTEESVNDVSKPAPYVRATRPQYTKEKVVKVARTPKAKISFDEALNKQLKSTINKEHPFNFEVYQNPTKSTITFNKKGDTATIRPTFKAKITFT